MLMLRFKRRYSKPAISKQNNHYHLLDPLECHFRENEYDVDQPWYELLLDYQKLRHAEAQCSCR